MCIGSCEGGYPVRLRGGSGSGATKAGPAVMANLFSFT